MARNEIDERNRRQSYSPNTRDFDREHNAQGTYGNRSDSGRDRFENQYSGNADRWTGYDEGPQHWREHRGAERGTEDYEPNRQEFGRGQDYGRAEGRDYRQSSREQYRHEDWHGPGVSGRDDRGPFQRDREREAGARREWGGRSYGSGVSEYGSVGPYSSPGLAGGHPGMVGAGGYGGGYSGGMGSYAGRGEGRHAGRGPKGYRRSDDRIREEINDRLTDHPDIDPSELEVHVENAIVTLIGVVEDRHSKRLAEDIAEGVAGVHDVNNQLRVQRRGEEHEQSVTTLGINPGDEKLKELETKK